MSHPARFRLTIANGGTDTPALSSLMSKGAARSTFGNAGDLMVYAPAALTGVVTVQIKAAYAGSDWKTLNDGTADITIAAGKAVQVPMGALEDLRIHSAAAEGAARDFDVVIQINLGQ